MPEIGRYLRVSVGKGHDRVQDFRWLLGNHARGGRNGITDLLFAFRHDLDRTNQGGFDLIKIRDALLLLARWKLRDAPAHRGQSLKFILVLLRFRKALCKQESYSDCFNVAHGRHVSRTQPCEARWRLVQDLKSRVAVTHLLCLGHDQPNRIFSISSSVMLSGLRS